MCTEAIFIHEKSMERHAVAVLERSGLSGILGERCSMVGELVGPIDQRERTRG